MHVALDQFRQQCEAFFFGRVGIVRNGNEPLGRIAPPDHERNRHGGVGQLV